MRGIAVDGKVVKRRRRELGLTQEQLAIRADCDARTIRNAERGRNVDAATFKSLASAIEVAASDLAQTAPAYPSSKLALECIRRWQTAFFDANVDALVATYREDGLLQLPSVAPVRGRVDLTDAYRQAFESFEFESRGDPTVTAKGNRVFLESGQVRMTSRGNREVVEAAAVHVFLLDRSQIAEHAAFYDTLPLAGIR